VLGVLILRYLPLAVWIAVGVLMLLLFVICLILLSSTALKVALAVFAATWGLVYACEILFSHLAGVPPRKLWRDPWEARPNKMGFP
jgi:hypothetical protein